MKDCVGEDIIVGDYVAVIVARRRAVLVFGEVVEATDNWIKYKLLFDALEDVHYGDRPKEGDIKRCTQPHLCKIS